MKNLLLIIVSAYLLSSCQTMPYQPYARDVKRKPNQGGIVALKPEHRDEDRAKAMTMMKTNCGTFPVNVLEEGEVVVGQESTTNSNTTKNEKQEGSQVGTLFGIPMMSGGHAANNETNSKVMVSQVKEWQINYDCQTSKTKK